MRHVENLCCISEKVLGVFYLPTGSYSSFEWDIILWP